MERNNGSGEKQAGHCGGTIITRDDEHQIKDKVFDQIFLDHLKSDFGLNILIAFLDKNLEKDDLADSVEKSMILMILGEKMISHSRIHSYY